jgi:hypothetical protein
VLSRITWEDDSLEAYKQLVRVHGIAANDGSQPEGSENPSESTCGDEANIRVPAGVCPDGVGLTLARLQMEDRGVCHCTQSPCQNEPPL